MITSPSRFQHAIFEHAQNIVEAGAPNLAVEAVAGSGKSSTLIEICNRLPRGTRATVVAFGADIAAASWDSVIFDLGGDGTLETEDDDVFGRACAAAETEIDEILGASHGTPFVFANLTEGQRNSVRDIAARLLPFLAVEIRPIASTDEKSTPYKGMYTRAITRAEKLAADAKRRLPGAGAPEPTSGATGVVEADADTSSVWTNVAAGNTTIGF